MISDLRLAFDEKAAHMGRLFRFSTMIDDGLKFWERCIVSVIFCNQNFDVI